MESVTMLQEIAGNGWTVIEPPAEKDEPSVVGRYNNQPIKAGILMEKLVDARDELHYRYRSGRYDLDVKIDFDIGRGMVRVERAAGYN